jgi:hypothetical protein
MGEMPETTLQNGVAIDVAPYAACTIQFQTDETLAVYVSAFDTGDVWTPIDPKAKSFTTAPGTPRDYVAGEWLRFELEGALRMKVEGLAGDTDVALNLHVNPFADNLIVAAATEDSVRAAMEQCFALGGGVVKVLRGVCLLAATLPMLSGVVVEGTTIGDLTFSTIPDSTWAFDEGRMTLFKGDGTFPAFSHNSIDSGTVPTVQADFANEMVTAHGLRFLAFDNFTAAFVEGAMNKGGGFAGTFVDLFVKNTTWYGFAMRNSMHHVADRIHVVDSYRGGVCLIECNVPSSILQTGNMKLGSIFGCPIGNTAGVTAKQRRQAKGVHIYAGDGGSGTCILNEVHMDYVQVNMFNRSALTPLCNFSNGSANVAVPDGSEFLVGMPIRFTGTPAAPFTTNRIYIVRSINGNNIQLSLSRTGSIITASANASNVASVVNGMPNFECVGTTPLSRITNGRFEGLDLEGGAGVFAYTENAQACRFDAVQWGNLANSVGYCGRNSVNCAFESLNDSPSDLDAASSSSLAPAQQGMLDRPGRGFTRDTVLGAFTFSVGGNRHSAIRNDGGFRMAPDAFFGLQDRSISATPGSALTVAQLGGITLTGTTPGQSITLPTVVNATGETGMQGGQVQIVNASNQSWTVNTSGGQLFNGIAGKTSIVIPAGHCFWGRCTATGYGGIVGTVP